MSMGRIALLLLMVSTAHLALAESREMRLCSNTTPLCVAGTPPSPSTLIDAENVYRTLFLAMDLPPPAPDLEGRITLHTGRETGASVAFRDPLATIDRGVVRITVAPLSDRSCESRLHIARALAAGAILSAAPATDATMTTGQSEWIARMAVPCATIDRAITFAPEAALAGPRLLDEVPHNTVQFIDFLDRRYARDVGSWLVGAWANTIVMSPPGAPLVNEPDFFDVATASYRTQFPSGFRDLFAAFLNEQGTRRVSHQWEIPWPKGPRRILSTRPVFPLGMAFVRVGPEGVVPPRLRFSTEWEAQTLMRWVAIVVGADGRTLKTLPLTGFDRGAGAERSIDNLAGAHHVELIGAAIEDRDFKFDPDIGLPEPHAWIATITSE